MDKIKQINNLKVLYDKKTDYYVVFTPDNTILTTCTTFAEAIKVCTNCTMYLNKINVNKKKNVKVALIDDDTDDRTYYTVRVPISVTNKEIQNTILEAICVMAALTSIKVKMPNITQDKLQIAKDVYKHNITWLSMYTAYVELTRGWQFIADNDADIHIVY